MSGTEIEERIRSELKQEGSASCFTPVKRVTDVKKAFEGFHEKGLLDEAFYQEWIEYFVFAVPEKLSKARSLITVATPQPQTRIMFDWRGASHSFVIPPTYRRYSDEKVEAILTRILKPEGYQYVRSTLPFKSLAVHGGLAQYGKNNISYIPGMGSFFRLMTYFSDLTCSEDIWLDAQVMDDCAKCTKCIDSCPTNAFSSDRFLIYAERCLTYHNENINDFPSWIKPTWHNALIGCMVCQRVCPVNKSLLLWFEDKGTFTEEETAVLLAQTPWEKLAPSTKEKVNAFEGDAVFDLLCRNLGMLLQRN